LQGISMKAENYVCFETQRYLRRFSIPVELLEEKIKNKKEGWFRECFIIRELFTGCEEEIQYKIKRYKARAAI